MEPTTAYTIFRNPEIHDLGILWHGGSTFSICSLNYDGLVEAASEIDAFTSYGTADEEEHPTFAEAQAIAHRHFAEMLHGSPEEQKAAPNMVTRRTRCEILREQEQAEEQLSEMPADAYRFEMQGWTMSFELAPRCEDPSCDICNG
jgi:hypothetical protein